MQQYDVAIGSGLLATLAGGLAVLVWVLTGDYSPTERLATRAGCVAAVGVMGAVGLAEWGLYSHVPLWGAFMLAPSVALGMIAAWMGGQAVYRWLGGGKEEDAAGENSPLAMEEETLAGQGGIWCELRDLPHFRETLAGDLINLVTGDCLRWIESDGQRCMEIRLGGQTALLGSRFETLAKYLAVQRGVARMLAP